MKCQLKGVDTKTAYDKLWEKHRIAIASTLSRDAEDLRFSPHIYNSLDDLDRATRAVKELNRAIKRTI